MDTKKILIKKSIINFYIYNKGATIADLSKEFNLSGPTVAKSISETVSYTHLTVHGISPAGGTFPLNNSHIFVLPLHSVLTDMLMEVP